MRVLNLTIKELRLFLKKNVVGFDLTTHYSYFTNPIKVFINQIIPENAYFMSLKSEPNTRYANNYAHNMQISAKLFDNVITLKTFLITITSTIHFFLKQKVS